MKKIILTFVTVLSIIACEKKEAGFEETVFSNSTDSTSSANTAIYDGATNSAKNDSILDAAVTKDTTVVKIQELKEEKKLLTEKVAQEMDSATRTTIISEIKITQQKIDSVKGKIAATSKKRQIAVPKIIRETKVIYRDAPTPKIIVAPTPQITKKGELEIMVDDLDIAQAITKDQIKKYDGVVKSEQISSYQNREFDYLKISVPLDKSDYLIADLENNVGTITSRNIEITGQEIGKNTVCHLEITLFKDSTEAAVAASPKSFGGRTLGAVGSGWNVIQEIFLLMLPFWPVFLIGGGVYYYYKKKRTEEVN